MEKQYSAKEVIDLVGISIQTLRNWYAWERKLLADGTVTEHYLPQPIKAEHSTGRPRLWTAKQISELIDYKNHMTVGRNGRYGKFTTKYTKYAHN